MSEPIQCSICMDYFEAIHEGVEQSVAHNDFCCLDCCAAMAEEPEEEWPDEISDVGFEYDFNYIHPDDIRYDDDEEVEEQPYESYFLR